MFIQKLSFPGEKSIYATADEDYLYALSWKRPVAKYKIKKTKIHRETEKQLKEYFLRQREEFDIPLKFQIGTDFQRKVWKALQSIPYSKLCSYSDIAQRINSPKAVRAVGAANGKNPIPIIIPCHRVIGKSGKLVGFSSGLDLKRRLLKLEGAL